MEASLSRYVRGVPDIEIIRAQDQLPVLVLAVELNVSGALSVEGSSEPLCRQLREHYGATSGRCEGALLRGDPGGLAGAASIGETPQGDGGGDGRRRRDWKSAAKSSGVALYEPSTSGFRIECRGRVRPGSQTAIRSCMSQ